MSREMFLLLLRTLLFVRLDGINIRKEQDNLAPIREVFEEFNVKCWENYQAGEYTAVDEMLEPFRRRCKFSQYIPSKLAKYDLKNYIFAARALSVPSTLIFMLVDSLMAPLK